jgi:aromatic-L-amino-acid/L-tryptophan decarboxylase
MTDKPGMTADEFRRQGHSVIDWIADYLADPEQWPVLPDVRPGDVAAQLPASPPLTGEPMDSILADFRNIIVPGTTHWNHPGFLAYFANTGTAEGVIGEALTAALNVNAMLWKTGPAQTELETRTLDWLRQMIGLPDAFAGTITDTASSSTLYALAAAREMAPDLSIREKGMAGRPELPRVLIYASTEAHSSIDKAAMTLGFGREGLRHVPTDDDLAMNAKALAQMIRDDRNAGAVPIAVVACVGTTSTTAIDPVGAIADVCAREKIWLHVDAAYGGSAAILPEMRHILDGCERADSLVVNPHKWLLTPMDCSVLFTRRPDLLKRAFQVIPDYLAVSEADSVINLMDYGVALGRRFRALKLWMVIRSFGVDGLASVIREHIRLAGKLARWVESEPAFELLAKPRFSTVVFRYGKAGASDAERDDCNRRIVEAVNATRETFISHTTVRGAYAIRVSIGNLRTGEANVRRAWELVKKAALATRG